MKRKILNLLILGILIIGLTGCGKNWESAKKYTLGKSVETDIASFKLLAGKFTYALVRTNNDDLGTAKEFDATEDDKSPYVASKGHTLVAITFYVENLDRSDVNFDYNFVKVKYEGKEYNSDIKYVATSEDNLNWERYNSSNILLLSNEKKYYRCYIDIDTDVKDLDSTVDLTITLPTSENKDKSFKYSISKSDRNEYKGEEITEEVAIQNYENERVKEYFKGHIEDYKILTGDEIKSVVNEKKFNVNKNGGWSGTFKFESSGRIYEGGNKYAVGYVNGRTWNIEDNYLVLSWVNGRKETISNKCEVRKINEEAYLLIDNGELFGILY